MNRLGRAQQHRADGDATAGRCLEEVVGNVGGIAVGQDQQVGLPGQRGAGHQGLTRGRIKGQVAMHLAIHLQPRRLLTQQRQGAAHLDRRGVVARAEVRMAEQGRLGLHAEAAHLLGGHGGDLAQFLGRGVVVDVGVHQEHLTARQHQAVHAGIDRYVLRGGQAAALATADHLVDVVQVLLRGAPCTAQHAVDKTLVQHHGADQRQAPAHLDLGHLHRDALAIGHRVVGLPEVAVTVVVLDIDDLIVAPFLQAKAELLDALGDHSRSTDQGGAGQAFIHHHLRGAQDALFLAFGIGHTLVLGALGDIEDRLHHGAGGVHEGL